MSNKYLSITVFIFFGVLIFSSCKKSIDDKLKEAGEKIIEISFQKENYDLSDIPDEMLENANKKMYQELLYQYKKGKVSDKLLDCIIDADNDFQLNMCKRYE